MGQARADPFPPVDAVAGARPSGHLRYSLRMADGLRDGRFVVLESLGEGAQGQTFDGVDKREGQRVAIKRFDVRGARTWKEMELAEREAQVLQSLTHPKLPRYIDHFEHDGALYLVMEKMEGESLASLRRRGVVFTEADVARFLADAADVLDYLHRRSPPVIHRDLKPANVIRRPDGSFAFVDFGSVRDKLRPEGGSTVVGTFGYMAPEQFQGRAFPASDVYGVGATALSMLAGAEPETLPHKGLAVDVRAALGTVGDGGDATGRPMVRVLERLLDPNPDTRANRIAPLLPELTRGRGPRASRSPPSSRTEAQGADGSRGAPSFSEARPIDGHRSVFEQQALELERRADDFDRRAETGGPAARGLRKVAGRLRREAARMRERAQWFDRHAARREARRARRSGRHDMRVASAVGRAYQGPPWPVRVFLAMLFLVGMIGVWFGTQLIAPFVLRRLAGLFPREAHDGLLHAATVVEESGSRAIRSIDRSRRWFLAMGPAASRGAALQESGESGELGESAMQAETRSRVASEAPAAPRATATGRARVATESRDADTEAQAHEEERGAAVEDEARKRPL